MAIGGKRSGAGRKSLWSHPSKMIRLPAVYESEIIQFAQKLDTEQLSGIDAKSIKEELQPHINAIVMSLKPSDRRAALKLFKKLTDRL